MLRLRPLPLESGYNIDSLQKQLQELKLATPNNLKAIKQLERYDYDVLLLISALRNSSHPIYTVFTQTTLNTIFKHADIAKNIAEIIMQLPKNLITLDNLMLLIERRPYAKAILAKLPPLLTYENISNEECAALLRKNPDDLASERLSQESFECIIRTFDDRLKEEEYVKKEAKLLEKWALFRSAHRKHPEWDGHAELQSLKDRKKETSAYAASNISFIPSLQKRTTILDLLKEDKPLGYTETAEWPNMLASEIGQLQSLAEVTEYLLAFWIHLSKNIKEYIDQVGKFIPLLEEKRCIVIKIHNAVLANKYVKDDLVYKYTFSDLCGLFESPDVGASSILEQLLLKIEAALKPQKNAPALRF